MIDELHKLLTEQTGDVIANNASAIAKELADATTGKVSVSLSLKLAKIGDSKLHCKATLSYSRKFKDETEGTAEYQSELSLVGKEAKAA